MNNDIKEILNEIGYYQHIHEHLTLSPKELDILKDYITNLQEKYERMKENAEILSNGYDELVKQKEKAIEYFKNQLENLDFYEDTKARILCAMGIVILQGEDKDVKDKIN